ncbi:hypothetical protein AT959_07795, partial [Dechloromonas denitrificans]
MSITPEEFLKFAEEAVNDANATEFDYRNSASRAYYSAFHCCYSEKQRCPGLTDNDIAGSHDRLYERFHKLTPLTSPVNTKLKKMAYVAKMMKAIRHDADYKIHMPFLKREAQQQISDA